MSGPMKSASLTRRPRSLTVEMMIIGIDYKLARPWNISSAALVFVVVASAGNLLASEAG